MYTTLTVLVEGALEREENFFDYLLLEEAIRDIAAEAEGDGYETEVFLQEHEHSPDFEECQCVQYLTDHRPAYVFPGDTPPGGEEPEEVPEQGDYILSDTGPLGSLTAVSVVEGDYLGGFPSEAHAFTAIRARMERDNFYPNVWRMSDHGNLEGPIDMSEEDQGR